VLWQSAQEALRSVSQPAGVESSELFQRPFAHRLCTSADTRLYTISYHEWYRPRRCLKAHGAPAYNGGLWAEPPARSRGSGAKPGPKYKIFLAFVRSMEATNLPIFSEISKRGKPQICACVVSPKGSSHLALLILYITEPCGVWGRSHSEAEAFCELIHQFWHLSKIVPFFSAPIEGAMAGCNAPLNTPLG